MPRFPFTAVIAIAGVLPGIIFSQERIRESADGVAVVLPSDESDLAGPMLKLAQAWQGAMRKGAGGSTALRSYLLSPKAVENAKRDIARFIGLEGGPDQAIHRDWDEAMQLALRSVDAWKTWEIGFETIHLWTKAEAAEVAENRGNLWVFQDTAVQVRENGAGVRLRPSFLPSPIDLDVIPSPEEVEGQRLDLVLAYRPGMTPNAITRQYNELLNGILTDPEKGVLVRPAAELFEAVSRRVFEKALERMLITDEAGEHFRKGLSLAVAGASNEVYNPKRGRNVLFDLRIRDVATQERREPMEELAGRMRIAPAWPSEEDGPAELAVREVALAMVFLSLRNGGDSLDSWIRAQEKPMDSRAFATRLDDATGGEGWEKMFREYCGKLATRFEETFAGKTDPVNDSGLSVIEQQWPRAVSGRVEAIHPPELAETAKLSAEKVDAILDEFASVDESALPPALDDRHRAILDAHGLRLRERSAAIWAETYRQMSMGALPNLRLRFWFHEDAMAALRKGTTIPGMEWDPVTGEASMTFHLGWENSYGPEYHDEETRESDSTSNMIIPITRNQAAEYSTDFQASAVARRCRDHLDDMIRSAQTGGSREERFFVMINLLAGESLVLDVIASADREWFVVGLSNWLAMRVTDAEFGEGAGKRIFEARWPPAKNDPDREQVDLLKWPTVDDRENSPYEATHVYFSTRAIESALAGREAEFVKRFVDEIRKTPRKRTNIDTVCRAFRQVGGGDLKRHARQVVAPPVAPKP